MLYQLLFVLSLVDHNQMTVSAKTRLEVTNPSITLVSPTEGWVCADKNIICNDRIECYCNAQQTSK